MSDLRLDIPIFGDYPKFIQYLNLIIGPKVGTQSLIDLCAHTAPVTQTLPFNKKVFVDVNPHSYPGFIQADVLGPHPVFDVTYDVSTCLDGIEHMHKREGWTLLRKMQAISKKQILFTPIDPWCVDPLSTDPCAHKCVWSPDELPGYASLVFPKWHEVLNIGAFFFWRCDDIVEDFERVKAGVAAIY